MTDRWQPIDTAPKDGTRFIGMRSLGMVWKSEAEQWEDVYVSDARWQDGRFRFRDLMSGGPSHWMPMP